MKAPCRHWKALSLLWRVQLLLVFSLWSCKLQVSACKRSWLCYYQTKSNTTKRKPIPPSTPYRFLSQFFVVWRLKASARCLWKWPLLWHPISGHPAYICVLLLEWDFWGGASGLPQGRLSWYNPLICCSLNTAVTALYRSSPGWLGCFLCFFLSRHRTGRNYRTAARQFYKPKRYCAVHVGWHCFLPAFDFNRP